MGRSPISSNALKRQNRRRAKEDQAQIAAKKEGIRNVESLIQNPLRPVENGIAQTFAEIVNSIRTEIQGKDGRPPHNSAVDIRLTFNAVEVKAKNLIIKKDQKESSVSLELATRILPD